MDRKGSKLFYIVLGLAFISFVIYSAISVGNYLKHKNDVIVVYEAGEVSEGFNDMERINNAVAAEEIEIEIIEETEFEDIEITETFEGNPNIPLSIELQKFIQEKCEEYSVNEAIVLMIIESESTFRTAVGNETILGGEEGKARYYGYMQLSAGNCNLAAKEYGLDAHTPEGNIEMGIILISKYIQKYGELDAVITAYKAGEGAADSGVRLKVCDELTDRVMYWQEVITE